MDQFKPIFLKLAKRLSVVIALLIVVAGGLYLAGYDKYFQLNYLLGFIRRVPDNWVSFAFFQGAFVIGSWLLVPLTVTAFLAMMVFPLEKAILATVLGVFLSSTVSYLIGRYGFTISKKKTSDKALKTVQEEMDRYGFWAIAILRLSPQPPFVVTSVLSGCLRVYFVKYLLMSFLGLAPLLILTLAFGYQALEMLKEPSTLAILTVVSLGLFVPLFYFAKKRWLNKRRTQHSKSLAQKTAKHSIGHEYGKSSPAFRGSH